MVAPTLTVSSKRRIFLWVVVLVPTFFLLLVELEQIHLARYHAQQENNLVLSWARGGQEFQVVGGDTLQLLENAGPRKIAESTAAITSSTDQLLVRQSTQYFADEANNYTLPPLDTLIDKDLNIIGDVQSALQFAIIGFGKCGTSTLMHWLSEHPQLQAIDFEVWDLVSKEPGRLVQRLHRLLPKNLPRGFKCPSDINQAHVIEYYRRYWPKTKLFVGIRHPIHWFKSLYNFRIQNAEKKDSMLHPNLLIGGCLPGSQMTCTVKSNYAYSLIRLGKQHWNGTRATTELERQIVSPGHGRRVGFDPQTDISYLPNDLFLFDLTQLGDANQTRKDSFRSSVQSFLGLTQELPDVIHFTPGLKWNETVQAEKDAQKIDICERQYIPLRRELMYLSRHNAEWMRTSFLDLPGVNVANREHFEEILDSHMNDPCGPESDQVTEEEAKAILEDTLLKFQHRKSEAVKAEGRV